MKLKYLILPILLGSYISVSLNNKIINYDNVSNSVSSSNNDNVSNVNTSSNTNTSSNNSSNDETKITLTFNANGGVFTDSIVKSIDIAQYSSYADVKDKFPKVKRENYYDTDPAYQPGWFFYGDSGKVIIDESTKFDRDLTLYANWRTYNITFSASPGTFKDGSLRKSFMNETCVHSDSIDTPTLLGSVFKCWTLNGKELSGNIFPYKPNEDSESIVLEAKYTTNVVKLCFSAGADGKFSDNSKVKYVNVVQGSSYGDNAALFKEQGVFYPTHSTAPATNKFVCYMCGGGIIGDDTKFTSSQLLSARYSTTYTITFDVVTNGGKWKLFETSENRSIEITTAYNWTFSEVVEEYALEKSPYTLENYCPSGQDKLQSLGWYTDKIGTASKKMDDTTVITSNLTLYAVYDIPYNIYSTGTSSFTIEGTTTFKASESTHVIEIKPATGYTFTNETHSIRYASLGELKEGTDYEFKYDPANPSNPATVTLKNLKRDNIYVTVRLTQTMYKITRTYPTGVAYYEGLTYAHYGDSISIKAIASPGYKITKISNGITTYQGNTASFSMPNQDITLTPTAEVFTYNITKVSELSEGVSKINLSHSAQKYNEDVEVNVTPSTGYSTTNIIVKKTNGDIVKEFKNPENNKVTFKMFPHDIVIDAKADKVNYAVTFNYNGSGQETISQRVIFNEKVTKPVTPVYSGKVFAGWFTTQECSGKEFNFDTPIVENITLYARWLEGEATISNDVINIDPDVNKSVKFTLKIGETVINENMTWESSDTSIATVDNNGNLTPTGAGHCYITVNYNNVSLTTNNFEIGSFSKFKTSYLESGKILKLNKEISGKVYVPSRYYYEGYLTSYFIDLRFYNDSEFLSTLRDGAFYKCTNITSVDISSDLHTIGCSSFEECTSLSDINLREGLTNICRYAFYNCSALTTMVIPSTVNQIGTYYAECDAFKGCSSLRDLTVKSKTIAEEKNPGNIYDTLKSGSKLIKVPKGSNVKEKITDNYTLTKQDENYDYYYQK